jgi:hypothetical protein
MPKALFSMQTIFGTEIKLSTFGLAWGYFNNSNKSGNYLLNVCFLCWFDVLRR